MDMKRKIYAVLFEVFLEVLNKCLKSINSKHLMVKRKNPPVKLAEKKQRIDPPQHCLIYKGMKFVDIPPEIGMHMLSMLSPWNLEASKRIPADESEWGEAMGMKETFSAECFGLFVKQGRVISGKTIAFMKGEIVILPSDSKIRPPPTNYDIQPLAQCTYTATQANGDTEVHVFDCYIKGTDIREPFNGQLCNHTCLDENQNCEFIEMESVEVSFSEDGVTHTLLLPLVGVRATKDIDEGSECLVDYGEFMLSDTQRDGFIPCMCASCAANANGTFVMHV